MVYDKIFGRKVKVRDAWIGMVRNAKAENRKQVLVYLEPYPHIRVDKAKPLQGWYKGLNEPNRVRARPCYTEAILTQPYGGWCPVGCRFCYVNSGIRGYRGTGLVTVPMDYGEQVAKQLSTMQRGSAGYFSPFHEVFNPLERVYHNAQRSAKEFVKVGLPVFFLSRLKYPKWALRLLTKSPYSYAQMSVNTPSEKDWKKLSPGAMSFMDMKAQIMNMKRLGIYVSIQINPVIPGITSKKQIVNLIEQLGAVGADHVIVKFLELGYSWVPTFLKRMSKRFGDRGRLLEQHLTQNMGGQRTIDEDYRMAAHKRFRKAAKRAGMTYSVYYEYKYQRDEDGQIIDKTGVSIGPKVTTSAQCHGHRVPVFTRNSTEDKFKPVRECPPSGCLYCASDNGGEPLCGDVLAGEAPALRMVDFRKPIRRDI